MNEKSPNNWPLSIGIDIGGTQIRVAVLQGEKLLSKASMMTGKAATPNQTIPRIYRAIEQVVDEAAIKLEQVSGIGIGVPGPVNSQTGIVFTLPNLSGWSNIPLRDIFVEHYGIPTTVENDGNTAALGEHYFGAGRNCNNMVYLTISTGIGGGVIVNGQLMRGVSGVAAELGHMTIDRSGIQCVCGNIGCLESTASGTAIARKANDAILLGIGDDLRPWATIDNISEEIIVKDKISTMPNRPFSVDAQGVAMAAKQGVFLAQSIIADAANALGVGLINIVHLFNPEVIVMGGGVTQIGALFIEPALSLLKERAMVIPYRDVRIVMAQMDVNAGIIGAGILNFLSDNISKESR